MLSNSIFSDEDAPLALLGIELGIGGFSSSPFISSSALLRNFADESNIKAPLFSKIYLSSLAGKVGESGTPMLLVPKIARRVTNTDESRERQRGGFQISYRHNHIHSRPKKQFFLQPMIDFLHHDARRCMLGQHRREALRK